jgi:hypothetical protein
VAVVVGVAGVLLVPGGTPGFGAPPEQVVRWTLDDRTAALTGSVAVAVAVAVLIVFYAGLRALLGRAEGAPGLLSTVGYGTFLVTAVLVFVAVALAQTQSFVALNGDPATVAALHQARFLVLNLAAAPAIVSSAAIGLAMLRTGFPARWAGWLSMAVAVGHVPALAALSRRGFLSPTGGGAAIGPVALAIWVVAVSALLVVRPRARSAT